MLFILNYVVPDEPVTRCEREVHGMGGLYLHDILHPNNLLRQYVNGHPCLIICSKVILHDRKVNDFFLK